MRIFNLVNALGDTYELTERQNKFLHTVKGLGLSAATEYARIGSHFELLSYNAEQGKIQGTIKFWEPREYFTFAKFCQHRPLHLEYTPAEVTYRRDGAITKIVKDEDDPLQSEVEFTCSTPFYQQVSEFNDGGTSAGGKQYDYEYSYTYTNSIAQSIIIRSESAAASPCRITIYGPCSNPTWRHYVDNTLVATGKVFAEIEQGRKLVIDTTVTPYQIRKLDLAGNVIVDLYQSSDFGTQRFINLQYGQNTISVSGDSADPIPLQVEGMIEYDTV